MTDRPISQDSPREDARPAPVGTVVDMRDAPATRLPGPDRAAKTDDHPMVDSSLVGDGGLPAMHARPGDGTTADIGEPVPTAEPAAMAGLDDVRESDPVTRGVPLTAAVDPAPRRPEPAPRRGGFLPLFLGGVCAAALGAGAAWLAIPRLPAEWRPVSTTALDPATVTAAVRAELDDRVPVIESRAVEAATAAAARAASASLAPADEGKMIEAAQKAGADAAARLIAEAPAGAQPDADVQATLAAQARQLGELNTRLDALGQQPGGPSVDLGPLQAQVQQLAQRPTLDPAAAERLEKLAADAEAATDRISAAARQAEARLAEAEDRAAELTAAADEAARRARAAAAVTAIGEAMQTGSPTAPALEQLQEAGVQPPAALAGDVPTLDTLAAEFPAAARAALRADLAAETASGQGSLVGNFLRAQTGARSVAPRDGTDADAVLSRAGDALQRGDVARALRELDALPDAARPAMERWTAKARTHAAAQAALSSLTAPQPPQAATPAASAAPSAAPAPSN